ncbi:hypothetical protein HQQ94_09350 [Shewanella sp. VB17]|uniref:hypothetical protein n=1 Tax=Shewanella sp. VB17 TaxID=2739432 RepID=UPI00156427D0|nr:hypothetical protein [Shewanella sp. VB17]NRD73446.1 hypothetical protein [Shewanella sp. VB17]
MKNFHSVLNCFFGKSNPDLSDRDAEFGVLTEQVEEMLELLTLTNCNSVDKAQLKQDIIWAFDQDNIFWRELDMEDGVPYHSSEGYSGLAAINWEMYFSDEFNLCSIRGEDCHHVEMLMLLVKKQIWDRIFPEERLPNYQQPESGQLAGFGDRYLTKIKPWNNWILE